MGGQKTRDRGIMIRFGLRMRMIRKEKKLTQKELAIMAGLSVSQIARIEAGILNTTISTFITISKAISVEPAQFMEGILNDEI